MINTASAVAATPTTTNTPTTAPVFWKNGLLAALLAEGEGCPTIWVTVKTWPSLVVRMAVKEGVTVITPREDVPAIAEEVAGRVVELAAALEDGAWLELATGVELAALLEGTAADELGVAEVELGVGVAEVEGTGVDELVGTVDELGGGVEVEAGAGVDEVLGVGLDVVEGGGVDDVVGVTATEVEG